MKLSLKAKLILIGGGIIVCALLGLSLYCKGKKVGAVQVKQVDLKKELYDLDREKHEIKTNVHALDTNALRTRILDLSSRVHEEAARSK